MTPCQASIPISVLLFASLVLAKRTRPRHVLHTQHARAARVGARADQLARNRSKPGGPAQAPAQAPAAEPPPRGSGGLQPRNTLWLQRKRREEKK